MATKEGCIFCTIGAGNSRKAYEDEHCFVVPDKYPSEYGHLLVISKDHHDDILATPDKTLSCMYIIAKRYATLLKERLGADGFVIVTNTGKEAGQLIFHTHIHIIPKYAKKRTGFMPHKELSANEAQDLIKALS